MSRRIEIGERIGEYTITGFLGAGGMGLVYLGVHNKINRAAAIKVLSAAAQGSNFIERFFNEARLQSSLHHPNIATLYDFFENGNNLFIVMEFVDGETLDALIGRRYFAVEDALATFESICGAVAFMHANNIVHRDIKPQNIKVAANGTVKLLDFGIAKGEVSHSLTRIGGVIGTPGYLAPEQLSGQPATPRSDIWALGVLFYEMLTGTEPFKGNTVSELYFQITTGKFTEPEKLNPAVPAKVSRIITKCLAVDATQRYQTISDVSADVKTALRRYFPDAIRQKKGRSFQAFGRKISLADSEPITGANLPTTSGGNTGLKGLAIGAALLLVVLVVGIGMVMTSGSSTENSNNTAVRIAAVPTRSPSIPAKPAATGGARAPQIQSGSTATSIERPRVIVEIVEGVAQVIRDGLVLGTTPVEIEGAENESVDLILKRDGYADTPVRVEITTNRKVYTFSMRRK